MIDLVLRDVKPRPMHVDLRCGSHAAIQPGIVAQCERIECIPSDRRQPLQVGLERFAPQRLPSLWSEFQSGRPRQILFSGQGTVLEGEDLIGSLNDGNMGQQSSDGITPVIVQVIQLGEGQSLYRRYGRGTGIQEYADQPSNGR